MQQFMKKFGLGCVLSVSTILCGMQPHDQLCADIQQLVVQLTDICNQKCSASSRASIRELLIEGRPVFVYQLGLIERGMSVEQMQADELVIEFRDTFGYRLQPVQEEIVNDLQDKGELDEVIMIVRGILDAFWAGKQAEIELMVVDASTAKKSMEYWLIVIDTVLENLQ